MVESNTDLSKVLKLLSFAKKEVIWLRFNCYSEYDAAVEAFLFFFLMDYQPVHRMPIFLYIIPPW